MINFKKYIPVGLVLIAVLMVLAGYFFVYPEYQSYTVKKKELENKDSEIAAKENYLPKLEKISEKLLEYNDQVFIIEVAFPSKPSIAALSNYLQKTIAQSGLILSNIDVSQLFIDSEAKEVSGSVKDMLFSATATGSYNSFKSFLLDIYLNARIIEIESFSFSSVQGGDASELISNDLLDYSINLKTHSYNHSYNVTIE